MKTKLLLPAVVCLLLLVGAGYAQIQQTPAMQEARKEAYKDVIRVHWDGGNTFASTVVLLRYPEFRAATNVSDELYREIQNSIEGTSETVWESPEWKEFIEIRNAIRESGGFSNANEETMVRFEEAQTRMGAVFSRVQDEALEKSMPPELKQKMREARLAAMGESPIISPSIFEALSLTDSQRQQMERIKREIEPDFEKHLEIYAHGQVILENKLRAEIARQDAYRDVLLDRNDQRNIDVRLREREQEIIRTLMEDSEYKRIYDATHSSVREFSTQFRIQMFDVLDDEQWRRLQELIDNPPAHARILIRHVKGLRGESEESKEDATNVWMPGPDSWRPGMPIPESYRIRRNTQIRFPRPANQ